MSETPAEHAPAKPFLVIVESYQSVYYGVMVRHNLELRQFATAGALACAPAILDAQSTLDPKIACGIAAYGLVEGSKAYPPPLAAGN